MWLLTQLPRYKAEMANSDRHEPSTARFGARHAFLAWLAKGVKRRTFMIRTLQIRCIYRDHRPRYGSCPAAAGAGPCRVEPSWDAIHIGIVAALALSILRVAELARLRPMHGFAWSRCTSSLLWVAPQI